MSAETFESFAASSNVIPVVRRIMADHLSPVLAYRRLVVADNRTAPSFLFESVENGDEIGRFSFLGAEPTLEIVAYENEVTMRNYALGTEENYQCANPIEVARNISSDWKVSKPVSIGDLPLPSFIGGWVGFAGYDTARYDETEKLPFANAPEDDRGLPELHFALYRTVVVFDHVAKIAHVIHNAIIDDAVSVEDAWNQANATIDVVVSKLQNETQSIPVGSIELDLTSPPPIPQRSNMTKEKFLAAVETCKSYISAGDAFQIVLSQRFEHRATVDPFEVYRALRVVNPSPYMIYLQAEGCILAASSPEILCRVRGSEVMNRPLAGTRKRGSNESEDAELEADLLSDEKEKSEHVMLVDLGRNDIGTVCELGSVSIESVMDIERYSHVMHLSSTLTGTLQREKDSWDALSATLPVGTVSGAPKIRAMQIIDELEPTKRGPYAGGIGMIGFEGAMDIAIALRTMVIPTALKDNDGWRIDIQAGAGVVTDSQAELEWKETINKAAALGRAIELAHSAFEDT